MACLADGGGSGALRLRHRAAHRAGRRLGEDDGSADVDRDVLSADCSSRFLGDLTRQFERDQPAGDDLDRRGSGRASPPASSQSARKPPPTCPPRSPSAPPARRRASASCSSIPRRSIPESLGCRAPRTPPRSAPASPRSAPSGSPSADPASTSSESLLLMECLVSTRPAANTPSTRKTPRVRG